MGAVGQQRELLLLLRHRLRRRPRRGDGHPRQRRYDPAPGRRRYDPAAHRRHRLLHGHVQRGQLLERRFPGHGHGHEPRRLGHQRLACRLDTRQRHDDRQRVERRPVLRLGRRGDGRQRGVQRHHSGGRHHDVRLHRDVVGQQPPIGNVELHDPVAGPGLRTPSQGVRRPFLAPRPGREGVVLNVAP
ncbi:hypothetical protein SGPA1_12798 [Streptomyces misionensis JCM 4497]